MNLKFDVTGMTCAACSARVEKVTSAVDGVNRADVNLLAGTMTVEADDRSVADKIIVEIQNAGYGASIAGEKAAEYIYTNAGATERIVNKIDF